MPFRRLGREHRLSLGLGLLAVVIVASSLLAVADYRAKTDQARQSQLALREARTELYIASAAEWEAIARQSIDREGKQSFEQAIASAVSRLESARRHDAGLDPDVRTVEGFISGYRRQVTLEFALLQSGDMRGTAIGELQVAALFRQIDSVLSAADAHAAARRSQAENAAVLATRLITAASLLSVLVVLALLRRARRRILVAQVEQQALQREAQRREFEASHDDLTGLLNRRGFFEQLRTLIEDRRDDPVAVLLLDLDGFKEINDTLGHATGDELLAQVGSRLASTLRPGDTIARLGGDEFAVLLTDLQPFSPDAALDVAGRLRGSLDAPFPVGGLALQVRGSVGVSIYPDHGPDADEVVRRADIAMYLAKTGGGVCLYASQDDPASKDALLLAAQLEDAIRDRQLILEFQPKASLADGAVTGVEALVRWQHPTKGLLPPDRFVPIAERNGLIRQLTLDVIDQVLAQQTDWRAEGIELTVAINLSIANLLDAGLPDDIERALRDHSADPAQIRFEITESYLLADPERISETIQRLSDLGIQIALDDFGTGYSSFTHLRQLPIDEIKIDRCFVSELDTNGGDDAIVRATIGLAQSLNVRVVAEGVETAAVWNLLRAYGCNQAQGYYLAKPMSASTLTGWLLRRESAARSQSRA